MPRLGKYADITGLSHAEVLAALYNNAGSAGMGAVKMFLDATEGKNLSMDVAQAEAVLRQRRKEGSAWPGCVNVDYLHGRRMKLNFFDNKPNRLFVAAYNECAGRPAQEVIAALRSGVSHE